MNIPDSAGSAKKAFRPRIPRLLRIPLSLAATVISSAGCFFSPATEARRSGPAAEPPRAYFRITVLDKETRRGIPCVELCTSDSRLFYTDSAGVIAFGEPDLLGKSVHFTIRSFGYTYPKNMLGLEAVLLRTSPGGSVEILLERVNVAERLYRVTGSGIYRDSLLLGDTVPATQDDADVLATGMDSVQAVPYRGRLFWLWGDTNISSASHGNFRVTCAISDLPGRGGLDPEVGVSLRYFRTENYPFVKPMVNDAHQVIWLSALRVTRENDGRERLFANYHKVKSITAEPVGRGVVEYDDKAEEFRVAVEHPADTVLLPSPVPSGPAFRHTEGGREYFLYSAPFMPAIRSGADAKSVLDLNTYEAFTCLKEGSRYDGSAGQVDRDAHGRLRWGWKRNTSPLDQGSMDELVRKGHLQETERWFRLTDVESGRTLQPQNGSVFWNAWRRRWISIRSENFGDSVLGEIWYLEGDTPLGPWVYGRKVVTHALGDKRVDPVTHREIPRETYSFYNPTQHPEFDGENGRLIYFEGTYTAAFSGARFPTPGYNYNQIMYRLNLDDPRLFLPVPIYQIRHGEEGIVYGTKERLKEGAVAEEVAFFAPDRPREGTVAVWRAPGEGGRGERLVLAGSGTVQPEKGQAGTKEIAFYAVAADSDIPSTSSASLTVNLYEFRRADGSVLYSIDESIETQDRVRAERPVCRVWPRRTRFNPYAVE